MLKVITRAVIGTFPLTALFLCPITNKNGSVALWSAFALAYTAMMPPCNYEVQTGRQGVEKTESGKESRHTTP